jgi:hypothetical protein
MAMTPRRHHQKGKISAFILDSQVDRTPRLNLIFRLLLQQ